MTKDEYIEFLQNQRDTLMEENFLLEDALKIASKENGYPNYEYYLEKAKAKQD